MIPSYSDLNYFLEASRTLNLSRAAERLAITQPALSMAIRRVEDALGTPILIRSKSGVKLTRAGDKLQQQARALVAEWEGLRGDILRDARELRGRYVVGCHPSVALSTLPTLLPALLRAHPSLELKLVHDLSRHIAEDVISFKIDFGIVVNPPRHPDLVVRRLYGDEVSFWCASGRPYVEDTLICDPALVQTQKILTALEKKGIAFRRTLTSSNLEVIQALVAAGAGVGILPYRVATRVKTPAVKPLGRALPSFQDEICLVYRADAQATEAARSFAQTIAQTLTSS